MIASFALAVAGCASSPQTSSPVPAAADAVGQQLAVWICRRPASGSSGSPSSGSSGSPSAGQQGESSASGSQSPAGGAAGSGQTTQAGSASGSGSTTGEPAPQRWPTPASEAAGQSSGQTGQTGQTGQAGQAGQASAAGASQTGGGAASASGTAGTSGGTGTAGAAAGRAGSGGAAGSAAGTPGNGGSGPATTDDKRAEIDRRFDETFAVFDERMRKEQETVSQERAARGSGSGAGGAAASGEGESGDGGDAGSAGERGGAGASGQGRGEADSGQGSGSGNQGDAGGRGAPAGSGSSTPGGGGGVGGGVKGGSGPNAVPADIPDGSDDDIVARQLREAAMKETDPELRERLWEEYRQVQEEHAVSHASSGSRRPARLLAVPSAALAAGWLRGATSSARWSASSREKATTEMPQDELLDVGVRLFDPNMPEDPEEQEKQRVFPDVRKAESRYMPLMLRDTLEGTGPVGPGARTAARRHRHGRDRRRPHPRVERPGAAARDHGRPTRPGASGSREGLRGQGRHARLQGRHVKPRDPFDNLYNTIANDLLAARQQSHARAARRRCTGGRPALRRGPRAVRVRAATWRRTRRAFTRSRACRRRTTPWCSAWSACASATTR